MAAPARAASMPDSAICCGVTGTCSDLPTVSPAPVSAHVMMTLLIHRWTLSREAAAAAIAGSVR